MAYPHTRAQKVNINSTHRPLGNPNHQKDANGKAIKRNPMVKMASKDSGTGNSVESSRSNGSKEGDFMEGGSTTSTVDLIKRKPFVKQASTGMVSFDICSPSVQPLYIE